MTKFEFLMMIASVVIAVGMTEIVGGWGRMARTPAKVSFDWLHFCWTLYLLLWSIQYWIGMWAYVGFPFEYPIEVYFLVIPTLFFVFAAFVITPDVPHSGELAVRDYYLARRRVVFLPLAAFTIFAQLADLVIVGSKAAEDPWLVLILPLVALTALPAFTTRIWLHAAVLGLLSALLFLFFFVEISVFDQRWQG